MHDLGDDARSILDTARQAHDPTDSDRKRLKAAMVVKLDALAASSTADLSAAWGAAAGPGAVARGLFGNAKVVATVIALSAAAAFAVWRSMPSGAPSTVERTTATASNAPPAESAPLAEDSSVLVTARTYLREGHPDRALALLDREAGRFDSGALRDEFLAVRGLATRALERNEK